MYTLRRLQHLLLDWPHHPDLLMPHGLGMAVIQAQEELDSGHKLLVPCAEFVDASMCRPHALSAHTSTFTGVQHHGSLLGSVCRLGYPQQAATIRSGSMTCNGMPDISALQYVHHLKAYFQNRSSCAIE